jgi:ribosomal protein L33
MLSVKNVEILFAFLIVAMMDTDAVIIDFFSNVMPITFNCKKCGSNNYSMNIKYEYPNKNELDMLGINEPDNAFTWIWITLKCNNCGKTYKNIVDIETD